MNDNSKINMDPLTKQGSLEFESEHAPSMPQQTPLGFLQSLWALIVAYSLYYRGISSIFLMGVFILFVVVSMDALVSRVHKFHHLTRDYGSSSVYDLKMAKMDHWCLQVCNVIVRCV